ncbi:Protein LANA1 [Planktothrix rubescens]|nr:Protein LANA1 [Planktothrix rubescens]
MSDFKKSKKAADSKRKNQGDVSDSNSLDVLVEDIEQADQEVDEQIQIIETKTEELKNLDQNLESVWEKLGEFEGDALQIAYQEINQKMEQKASEIDESRGKLETIKEDMLQKQSEITEQIKNRDDALTELEETERKCDADLSESKDAVNDEKENLEDTNSKIEEILKKIDAAISNAQSKADNIFSKIGDASRELGNRFHTLIDEFEKTVINTAKSSVATFMTISGVCTLLLDLNNKATIQSPEGSSLSFVQKLSNDVQKQSNDNEDEFWINSNFTDMVDAQMVPDRKKKKKKAE